MIKKIMKEIQKLEQKKKLKEAKKDEINNEINTLNTSLKELYALKSQYEKLQQNTDNIFNKHLYEEE